MSNVAWNSDSDAHKVTMSFIIISSLRADHQEEYWLINWYNFDDLIIEKICSSLYVYKANVCTLKAWLKLALHKNVQKNMWSHKVAYQETNNNNSLIVC